MRTLITGASGFIGSRLALRCREAGMEVVALGRVGNPIEVENAAELAGAGVPMAEVPVADREGLFAAMAGVDAVFHLAAAQHEANVPDAHFQEVNVLGTRNVLAAAERAGVRRLVYGSTIGVFRWTPGGVVSEQSPLEPDNIYGVTKLEAEGQVRAHSGRLERTIVRISETYGPGDRRLQKLFRAAERGPAIQIGDGANLHHLVYIDDLLDGLIEPALRPEAIDRTLVLAGERAVSTREMLQAVSRAVGGSGRLLRVPLAPVMLAARVCEGLLRPLGIQPPLHRRRMDFFRKSFAFEGGEARALGYKPRVGVVDGMRATAAWYRERGAIGSTT